MFNLHGDEQTLKTLDPGAYFGEIGLVYNTIRTCTVKTTIYSAIASLNKESYHDVLTKDPTVEKRLKQLACDYEDPWENFVMTAFDRVPYFNDLPELVSNELMYSLSYKHYGEGDTVIAVGDVAENLMIISKGRIKIDFEIKDLVAA
jgi:CRP-like cAMP-binding protein